MIKIDFLATDGIKLNGFLYQNEIKTTKVILSIHGMSSNCFKERDTIIAKYSNENNIDYFCFNNRGSELVKYIEKEIHGKKEKMLGGTTYEDVLESYEDIVGAILKLIELGYKNIYLQGHSLGSTKIVYTYHKLQELGLHDILDKIKGICLLSLIDIPCALKIYIRHKFDKYLELAQEKEKLGNLTDIMPKDSFIHPISVKTFLRYARDNKDIDFAKYGKDSKLEYLNQIQVPLFMRWGNDNEMILQNADELVALVNKSLLTNKKDIDYIDGANHSYSGKEEILAEQIIQFIKKYE